MPVFILEDIENIVHLIRESNRDAKGRAMFTTKCGAEIERDVTANVTGWDSLVTCPRCAIPWVK